MGRGTMAVGGHRDLSRRIDDIRQGMNDLGKNVSLFDDVADRLPGLLNSLLERRQPPAEPKVSVQALVGVFYPSEGSRDVSIPILVRNAEDAAPARDVAVQLSVASEKEPRPLLVSRQIGASVLSAHLSRAPSTRSPSLQLSIRSCCSKSRRSVSESRFYRARVLSQTPLSRLSSSLATVRNVQIRTRQVNALPRVSSLAENWSCGRSSIRYSA